MTKEIKFDDIIIKYEDNDGSIADGLFTPIKAIYEYSKKNPNYFNEDPNKTLLEKTQQFVLYLKNNHVNTPFDITTTNTEYTELDEAITAYEDDKFNEITAHCLADLGMTLPTNNKASPPQTTSTPNTARPSTTSKLVSSSIDFEQVVIDQGITVPQADNPVTAFLKDPKISQEIKTKVNKLLTSLSKGEDGDKDYSAHKQQVEYLLNFPGFGAAVDEREQKITKIVNEITSKIEQTSDQFAKELTLKQAIDEQLKIIEDKFDNCEISSVEFFKEVFISHYIEELTERCKAKLENRDPKHIPFSPIDLDGPPGTGKTAAVEAAAKIMGLGFDDFDMPSETTTNGVNGVGTEYQGGGRPGLIVKAKNKTKTNSVVMLIDEAPRGKTEVLEAFGKLLAVDTATSTIVEDKYFNLNLPARGIYFVLTSNDYNKLPEHIKSRARKINFPGYSVADKLKIIQTKWLPKIDQDYQERITQSFTPKLQKYLIERYSYLPGVRELQITYKALISQLTRDLTGKSSLSIDEQYIDNCLTKASITKLTDEQVLITQFNEQFEKHKNLISKAQDISKNREQLIANGAKALAQLELVLQSSYKHNDQITKEYKEYATKLQTYLELHVLQNKYQDAKQNLNLSNTTPYISQKRIVKLNLKKQLLKTQLKSSQIELASLSTELASTTTEHKDKIIGRKLKLEEDIAEITKQKDLVDTKSNIIALLLEKKPVPTELTDRLIKHKSNLVEELNRKNALELQTDSVIKKIKNIDRLLTPEQIKSTESTPKPKEPTPKPLPPINNKLKQLFDKLKVDENLKTQAQLNADYIKHLQYKQPKIDKSIKPKDKTFGGLDQKLEKFHEKYPKDTDLSPNPNKNLENLKTEKNLYLGWTANPYTGQSNQITISNAEQNKSFSISRIDNNSLNMSSQATSLDDTMITQMVESQKRAGNTVITVDGLCIEDQDEDTFKLNLIKAKKFYDAAIAIGIKIKFDDTTYNALRHVFNIENISRKTNKP